jgi:hypothetical protein
VCGFAADIELSDEGHRFARLWKALTDRAPEPRHK